MAVEAVPLALVGSSAHAHEAANRMQNAGMTMRFILAPSKRLDAVTFAVTQWQPNHVDSKNLPGYLAIVRGHLTWQLRLTDQFPEPYASLIEPCRVGRVPDKRNCDSDRPMNYQDRGE
jgi:hypothetical protein